MSKKNTIALCHMGISQYEISHRLKISCRCIRQIFRKFAKFHTVITKPGAGRRGVNRGGRNDPLLFKILFVLVKKSEENVFLGVFWCWICTDEDITPPCFTSLGYWEVTPLAGRPPKVTGREKRLIKLQQLRDDTASLADLVRYVNTNFNLSIGRSMISRILQGYNIVSYIAPRKPRTTPIQR